MKRFFKYLYYCALTFCSLFAIYYMANPYADNKAFFFNYKTFMFAASVVPLPFFFNNNLAWRHIKCETFIGLMWSFFTPMIHKFAYGSANLPEDIAAGCYVFFLLITLKWFFRRYFPFFLAHALTFIIQLIIFLPALLNAIYYTIYSHPLSINAAMAIMQTTPPEAREYLFSIPFYSYFIFFLILFIFTRMYKQELNSESPLFWYEHFSLPKITAIIILVPSTAIFSFLNIFINTKLIDSFHQSYCYFSTISYYRENRADFHKTLYVKRKSPTESPHTIIIVIGESASKDYMHAFSETKDNTTPWLSKNENGFILFSNAYSCAYSTISSLQRALTSSNFYNQTLFSESASIIDIAKASGYKTYWFSNQGKIGKHDTPTTLIAEQSDKSHWLNSDEKYDGKLIQLLDKVNPEENNFIVFHLMGSHAFYSSRYPKEYQVWKNPNYTGGVEDYKNSILYTDHVLKSIFEHAQGLFNLASLIYFSDHATDPTILRDPDSSDFKNLRIPLAVYLSDSYKKERPKIASLLEQNKNKPFSNDLLYNLLCSIIDIESNYFDESESIASPKYKFDFSNVKTNYGKAFVKDDPYNTNQK